jgi:Lrp/AsnC family transcriptional regulator for asnA, asnC and gidA
MPVLRDAEHDLSAFDKEVFRLLQEDGRRSFVAMAEDLGVDETRVRRRVEKLIADDVFSVTVVADPRLLGLDYMAWIGITALPAFSASVAAQLVAFPEVKFAARCSGRLNVMAEVACVSAVALQSLLDSVRMLEGVDRVESAVYLDVLQQRFQWLVDDQPGEAPHGVLSSRAPASGPGDAALIRELRRDGRASFRDLGDRLGLTGRAVSKRLQELIAARAVQVIAVANPLNFGFTAMAWLGIRTVPGVDSTSIARRLTTVSGLDYVVVPAGPWDLMAELVCHDQLEMTDLIETRIGAMEGVRLIETFPYSGILYGSTTASWGVGRIV